MLGDFLRRMFAMADQPAELEPGADPEPAGLASAQAQGAAPADPAAGDVPFRAILRADKADHRVVYLCGALVAEDTYAEGAEASNLPPLESLDWCVVDLRTISDEAKAAQVN